MRPLAEPDARLDELKGRRRAVLRVEEVAERGLRQQLHRRGALRLHRRLVAADLDRRLRHQLVAPQRALGDGAEHHPLAHVDGRVRRREGAERGHRGDARKETGGADQRVRRRQVGVDARERADPVRDAALVFRTARHVVAAVAVLRRLLEEDAVLDDRAAQLEIGSEAGDAVDVVEILVALAAEGRAQVVEAHVPGVAAAARLDHHQAGGEAAVLDRVRVRHHRDRVDGVVGQREVHEAEHRIGQRAGADLDAGLGRPSAFDADAARHLDHAREQTQRPAEPAAVGELVGLMTGDRLGPAERVRRRHDRGRRHHFDRLRQRRQRQIQRPLRGLIRRDDHRRAGDGEAIERRGQRVLAFLDRGETEMAVAVRQHRRDFLIR